MLLTPWLLMSIREDGTGMSVPNVITFGRIGLEVTTVQTSSMESNAAVTKTTGTLGIVHPDH